MADDGPEGALGGPLVDPRAGRRRVLVTAARLPFALDTIRKLGEAGHTVFAADSERSAPGLGSKHVEAPLDVPPTYAEPEAFVQRVAEIVETQGVDVVVPAFEEVFLLAKHREALGAELFAPDFETLVRLHDKSKLVELARELGVRIAPTRVVRSKAELKAAIGEFDPYFARPAFGRGGVELLTNHGALAGALDPDAVEPTDAVPWIVQGYVEGIDVCTFSVAHHGKLTGHSTYEHPKTIADAGGIVFESVDCEQTLAVVRYMVEVLGYHGHISFDFLRGDDGLYLVECNPRPTNGIAMWPTDLYDAAFCDSEGAELRRLPAGRRAKIGLALLRDMVLDWRSIPENLRLLFDGSKDIYAQGDDLLPLLYTFLSYRLVSRLKQVKQGEALARSPLVEAQFVDISWNGEPLP